MKDIPGNDDIADASFVGSVKTSAMNNLHNQQITDGIKPMFDIVPSELDVVASELADINHTYDDNILHARFGYRTNLSKYEMPVGSTTATCGQHILYDKDLVSTMDGSLLASSYNGYRIGSIVGSTFGKMLVMQFRPMLV